ncbi:hypothetical protein BDW72DRAFT_212170 [Aspergillus terricola var. indicus]
MIRDTIPTSPSGFTIFTTRNHQLATRVAGPNIVNVTEMDVQLAVAVLKSTISNQNLLGSDTSVASLARHLHSLPLAMVQAASYINENLISTETYLSLVKDTETSMLELLSKDFENEWRYIEAINPISSTWVVSFKQIQTQSLLAADYLSYMSCLGHARIPLSLFPAAESRVKQQSALGHSENGIQCFSLHQLVRLVTRNWLRTQNMLDYWTKKTGQHLKDAFPVSKPENRVLWRSCLPHAQHILGHEQFQARTLDREELAWKVDDPAVLSSLGNLASTLMNLGRWSEAQMLERKVFAKFKSLLGEDHPKTLTSMSNLATTHRMQGQYSRAEELDVRVLKHRAKVLGPEHLDTRSQGKLKEAEELEEQVMRLFCTTLGRHHPDTLTSMSNLACTYRYQGRYMEAECLEIEVLEERKGLLGKNHSNTLTSMWNLARTWRKQEKNTESMGLLQACIQIQNQQLGPDHPDTVEARLELDAWQSSVNENWILAKHAE